MTSLTTLRKQRAGRRTQIRKLKNKLEEIIVDITPNLEDAKTSLEELERQKSLVVDLDNLILQECGEEGVDKEIEESSEFSMELASIMSKVKILLANRSHTQVLQTKPIVKLPDLKLISFDGDPLQWCTFWDLFQASIHNRAGLTGAQKFLYLVAQLKGDAANLLQGFQTTDASYDEAVDLLTKTYGRKNRLIQARLHALFDLEIPSESSIGLRNFRANFEGHIRALHSMGANVNESSYIICELILRKCPLKIRDNIGRLKIQANDIWTLEELREALSNEINHLETLDASKSAIPTSINKFKDLEHTAAFNVTVSNPNCRFCLEKNHNLYDCAKYNNGVDRSKRASELRLCFNCLRPNHTLSQCINQGRCKACGRKHHTLLCNKAVEVAQVRGQDHPNQPPSKTNQLSQKVSDTLVNNVLVMNSDAPHDVTTILPTALVEIVHNNRTMKCKALFDGGSQKSFILSKVVNKYHLPICGQTKLCIDGFESTGSFKQYDIAEVAIKAGNEMIKFGALVIDQMPARLTMSGRSDIVQQLMLRGIALADDSMSDDYSDLSVLIGSDNYHKFMIQRPIINDIYTTDSKVGTLIGGTIPNTKSTCSNASTVLTVSVSSEMSLGEQIKSMWESVA